MMLRFVLFGCLLAAVVIPAHAQQTRERLDGFNGIRFGTSFVQAKQALGAEAKETSKVSKKNERLKMLDANLTIEGQAFRVGYIFDSGDRLSVVRLAPIGLAFSKDKAACEAAGARMLASLVKQYGAPTNEKPSATGRSVFFSFKDGNEIEALLSFGPIGCMTTTTFATPAGKQVDA